MKFPILVLSFLLLASISDAQGLQELYKKSKEAYDEGKIEMFRTYNLQALELHPSQPTLLFNSAIAESLLGNAQKSHHILCKLLSWNANLDYLNSDDLSSVLNSSVYKIRLGEKADQMSEKINNSFDFFELPETCHLEDLAIIGDELAVTDVYHGSLTIYNIQNTNKEKEFHLEGSAMAVVGNMNENCIWVSASMMPQYKNYEKDKVNQSLLYKIDLNKGEITCKIEIPGESVIGSMVLSEEGLIYASSSATPLIFVIDSKENKIVELIEIQDAFNLQGISIDPKNEHIYVADYIKGILQIDMNNHKNRHWLISKDYLLKGIDGLIYTGENELIAIQNNSNPHRVTKLHIEGTKIKQVIFLDNALGLNGEPTNGKYIPGKGFYYIANSQWPFYDKESRPNFEKWNPQSIRVISE